MKILRSRELRLILLVCLCVFTIHKLWTNDHKTPRRNALQAARSIPVIDTRGQILGNPKNAEADLKSIYNSVTLFRQKHKHYPRSSLELFNDIWPNFQAYGFADRAAVRSSFNNPDAIKKRPWIPEKQIENVNTYEMLHPRFDGQPLGSTKRLGERDVIAWTDDYFYPNVKNDWGKANADTANPVGFYVVLWDDGQIERIPFQKVLSVPKRNGDWGFGFSGQAGLPAGTKTLDEYLSVTPTYKKWKRAQ